MEKQTGKNGRNLPDNTRSSLLALAGGYVLYLAWELLNSLRNGTNTMPFALAVAAIVFFGLAGIAVIALAGKIWWDGRKGKNPPEDENPPRPEDLMKE